MVEPTLDSGSPATKGTARPSEAWLLVLATRGKSRILTLTRKVEVILRSATNIIKIYAFRNAFLGNMKEALELLVSPLDKVQKEEGLSVK